jgi:hypothetical protein
MHAAAARCVPGPLRTWQCFASMLAEEVICSEPTQTDHHAKHICYQSRDIHVLLTCSNVLTITVMFKFPEARNASYWRMHHLCGACICVQTHSSTICNPQRCGAAPGQAGQCLALCRPHMPQPTHSVAVACQRSAAQQRTCAGGPEHRHQGSSSRETRPRVVAGSTRAGMQQETRHYACAIRLQQSASCKACATMEGVKEQC